MKGVTDWLNPKSKPKSVSFKSEEQRKPKPKPSLLVQDLPGYSPSMHRLYSSALEAAHQWYEAADTDGNQFIDKTEFAALWQKQTGTKLSNSQLHETFGKITSADKISFQDVCVWRVNCLRQLVPVTKLKGYARHKHQMYEVAVSRGITYFFQCESTGQTSVPEAKFKQHIQSLQSTSRLRMRTVNVPKGAVTVEGFCEYELMLMQQQLKAQELPEYDFHTRKLCEHVVSQVIGIFEECDPAQSGAVKFDQCARHLCTFASTEKPTDIQLRVVFETIDVDKNGVLTMQEFAEFIQQNLLYSLKIKEIPGYSKTMHKLFEFAASESVTQDAKSVEEYLELPKPWFTTDNPLHKDSFVPSSLAASFTAALLRKFNPKQILGYRSHQSKLYELVFAESCTLFAQLQVQDYVHKSAFEQLTQKLPWLPHFQGFSSKTTKLSLQDFTKSVAQAICQICPCEKQQGYQKDKAKLFEVAQQESICMLFSAQLKAQNKISLNEYAAWMQEAFEAKTHEQSGKLKDEFNKVKAGSALQAQEVFPLVLSYVDISLKPEQIPGYQKHQHKMFQIAVSAVLHSFQQIDENTDGSISQAEVAKFLKENPLARSQAKVFEATNTSWTPIEACVAFVDQIKQAVKVEQMPNFLEQRRKDFERAVSEAVYIFHKQGKDISESLTLEEYSCVMPEIAKGSTEEEIKESFTRQDKNCNGMIDLDELVRVLIEHLKLILVPEDFPNYRKEKRAEYERLIKTAEKIFKNGRTADQFVQPTSEHLKISIEEATKLLSKLKQNPSLRDLTFSIVQWHEFQVNPQDLPHYSPAVHKMFEQAILEAQSSFDRLDKDQNGLISEEEFLQMHSKESALEVFKKWAVNGHLTFQQLIQLNIASLEAKIIRPENVPGYTDARRQTYQTAIEKAEEDFALFDGDRNSTLGLDEFIIMFGKQNPGHEVDTPELLKDKFSQIDRNGNGTVSMVEYIQYQVGRIEAELKPQDFQGFSPEREPAISEILRQTKEEFGRADVNRDGSISFSEYKKVVKKGRFETEAQQRQTFDKIDTSKEGQVSLQEMVQFRITKKFGKPQAQPQPEPATTEADKVKLKTKLLADFSNQLVEGQEKRERPKLKPVQEILQGKLATTLAVEKQGLHDRQQRQERRAMDNLAQIILYGNQPSDDVIQLVQHLHVQYPQKPELKELLTCLSDIHYDIGPSIKWLRSQLLPKDQAADQESKFINQSSLHDMLKSLMSSKHSSEFMAQFLAEFTKRGYTKVPSGISISMQDAANLKRAGVEFLDAESIVQQNPPAFEFTELNSFTKLFTHFTLDVGILCLRNSEQILERFEVELIFYDKLYQFGSELIPDPLRDQDLLVPVLTFDTNQISALHVTIPCTSEVVRYMKADSMIFRIRGAQSRILYFQSKVKADLLLTTSCDQHLVEVPLQKPSSLVVSMCGTWHSVQRETHRRSGNQKHSVDKGFLINPALPAVADSCLTQQMIQDEKIRKSHRVSRALSKYSDKQPLQMLQYGSDYVLQQWLTRQTVQRAIDSEQAIMRKLSEGNALELQEQATFGMKRVIKVQIKNQSSEEVQHAVEVKNARLVMKEGYMERFQQEEVKLVPVKAGESHVLEMEYLCTDSNLSTDCVFVHVEEQSFVQRRLPQAFLVKVEIQRPPIQNIFQCEEREVPHNVSKQGFRDKDLLYHVKTDGSRTVLDVYELCEYQHVQVPYSFSLPASQYYQNPKLFVSKGEGFCKPQGNDWCIDVSEACTAHLVDQNSWCVLRRFKISAVNEERKQTVVPAVAQVRIDSTTIPTESAAVAINYNKLHNGFYSHEIHNSSEKDVVFDVVSGQHQVVQVLTPTLQLKSGEKALLQLQILHQAVKQASPMIYLAEKAPAGNDLSLKLKINF